MIKNTFQNVYKKIISQQFESPSEKGDFNPDKFYKFKSLFDLPADGNYPGIDQVILNNDRTFKPGWAELASKFLTEQEIKPLNIDAYYRFTGEQEQFGYVFYLYIKGSDIPTFLEKSQADDVQEVIFNAQKSNTQDYAITEYEFIAYFK